MINIHGLLPYGYTWRELWMPELINGASLPASVPGGHSLTLTGAVKATSANGVRLTGAATSNINCGALHNSATKLWLSLFFKLDADYAAGAAANQFLFGKKVDSDNRLILYLNSGDGKLYWTHVSAAAVKFEAGSTQTSWNAGSWYHVIASLSDDGATQVSARLVVNGGAAQTAADATRTAAPAAGDFVLGDEDDPGAGTGFKGVLRDITIGTDDLSANEETDLYKGVPPADAVERYLCDEGRGTTATSRGSAANNGTLDTSASWDFTAASQQAVLSLDGVNDKIVSSSGVSLSGELSIIEVFKTNVTFLGLAARASVVIHNIRVDDNNRTVLYYAQGVNKVWNSWGVGGSWTEGSFTSTMAAPGYYILVNTRSSAATTLYQNGASVLSLAAVPNILGDAAVTFGDDGTSTAYCPFSPFLLGIVEGAFTAAEVVALSRTLNDYLKLGLSI